ncbi:hypothetical protein OGAPHI_003236 [Ogataea philodendri]|uniref:Uncharacterized protein n=1 Tax=Ogataea philodendri TaxID=1378263 RepID=A0A9P8P7L1_9ASCO|nr:uncharacterized protein OGAPHI_003236 [Ogataea philodendri]KAH3666787.1 hypothetical protein OGAPHI_003236 [Ogataea philodendri]
MPALVSVDEVNVQAKEDGDEPVSRHERDCGSIEANDGDKGLVEQNTNGNGQEDDPGGNAELVLRLEVSFRTLKNHKGRCDENHDTQVSCTEVCYFFVSGDHVNDWARVEPKPAHRDQQEQQDHCAPLEVESDFFIMTGTISSGTKGIQRGRKPVHNDRTGDIECGDGQRACGEVFFAQLTGIVDGNHYLEQILEQEG